MPLVRAPAVTPSVRKLLRLYSIELPQSSNVSARTRQPDAWRSAATVPSDTGATAPHSLCILTRDATGRTDDRAIELRHFTSAHGRESHHVLGSPPSLASDLHYGGGEWCKKGGLRRC